MDNEQIKIIHKLWKRHSSIDDNIKNYVMGWEDFKKAFEEYYESFPVELPVKPANGGLSERLQNIIDTKKGNNEVAIFCNGGSIWNFLLGNTSGCVQLGEASGEYETEGESIEDVITKMEIILNDSRLSV